jgi:heme-degrading monooxygenase HmoA
MVEGFRRGGPELRRFPGFLRFELWRNDETLEAVSRWESREAMDVYRNSPIFGAHHGPGTVSGRQRRNREFRRGLALMNNSG